MIKTHRTYCRNCPSLCGLEVEVEDNRVVSITGDREHSQTQGYFCIKGLMSKDLHDGEDRLQSSLKGRSGNRVEVDVEQALDEIHDKLATIIGRYGSNAVALYYGTGANMNALSHSALKGGLDMLGSPYIFSSMTLDQSAKWVTMGRMGWFAPGQHSIQDADVAMAVGCNPLISHHSSRVLDMQNPRGSLLAAKKRGVKLIVVDPRFTETAKRADLHLQIKPGEDVALFAGMIRLVLERGWEDRDFCARFIAPLDALRAAVADFTPDYVANRTGVPWEQIEAAVKMFAEAKRTTAGSGTGPNMGPHSNLSEHLLQAFNAICGGYRRAGDIVRSSGVLFARAPVVEGVIPAGRPWERGPKLRTADIGPMFGEYPTALLPDEINGRGEDRIRALIVVGGNPLKALSDPAKTLPAFAGLDLLVTLDIRATETTEMSDYVISTSLSYERFDYTGMWDPMLTAPFAQLATPFIERPAGVIDDWEFFWGLAKRMGRQLELKRPLFGVAHAQIPGTVVRPDMTTKPTTEELMRQFTGQGAVSYEELLASPQGVLRSDDSTTVQPAAADDGVRLEIFPPDVAMELQDAKSAQAKDGFGYRLIVRRMLETMNSAYRNASGTRSNYPVNPAYMHPLDMEQEGLTDGMSVDIASAHGALTAQVKKDPTMRRGVIAIAHTWGAFDAAADPNGQLGAFTGRLISLDSPRETINYMPWHTAVPVNLKKHIQIKSSVEPVAAFR